MPLELWAPDGRRRLRIGQRCFKRLGMAQVGWNFTGAAKSGTITDPRFTAYPANEPRTIFIDGQVDVSGNLVTISFSGNTLTWSYRNDPASPTTRPNAAFLYGIW